MHSTSLGVQPLRAKWQPCHSSVEEAEEAEVEGVAIHNEEGIVEISVVAGPEPQQSAEADKGAEPRHTPVTRQPDIKMGLPSSPA